MPGSNETLYQLVDLKKHFRIDGNSITVLDGLNLSIPKGLWVSLVGPSGSGKTTLLHLLGGLDQPSDGKILLEKRDLARFSRRDLSRLRRDRIGFIFQSYHLFPELTALENAVLPALSFARDRDAACHKASQLLEDFGLGKRLEHRPRELSGGEQQRVAIARALINDPQIILADEPTGNLDTAAAAEIIRILNSLRGDKQRTIVMVTHDMQLAAKTDRVIRLREGQASLHKQ
jgi:putative ABC transport system ATP-binding protein